MTSKHFLILIGLWVAFTLSINAQEVPVGNRVKHVDEKAAQEQARRKAEAEHLAKQREGMAASKAEDEAAMKAEHEKKLKKMREREEKAEKEKKEEEEKQKEKRKKKSEEAQKNGKSKHSTPSTLGGNK